MSLEGKSAVVTGGDSGIGHAISLEMGRQGAFVTINYHKNQAAADATVKAIEAEGGKGQAVQGAALHRRGVLLGPPVFKICNQPMRLKRGVGLDMCAGAATGWGNDCQSRTRAAF